VNNAFYNEFVEFREYDHESGADGGEGEDEMYRTEESNSAALGRRVEQDSRMTEPADSEAESEGDSPNDSKRKGNCQQIAPGVKRKKGHVLLEDEKGGRAKYGAVVDDMRLIPGVSIAPEEVLGVILRHWEARPREKRGKKVNEPSVESIRVLIRFFFNVASPEAFEECREMCTAAIRLHHSFPLNQDIAKTLVQLDRLEKQSEQILALWRLHLAHLVQLRSEMTDECQANRRRYPKGDQLAEDKGGRISSQTLHIMMKKACPQLKQGSRQYKKCFDRLKNQLKHGKSGMTLVRSSHRLF